MSVQGVDLEDEFDGEFCLNRVTSLERMQVLHDVSRGQWFVERMRDGSHQRWSGPTSGTGLERAT